MASTKSRSTLHKPGSKHWLKQIAFGIGVGVVIQSVLEGFSTFYVSDYIESYFDGPTIWMLHDSLVIASLVALGITQQKKVRSLQQTSITLGSAFIGFILSAMIGVGVYVRLLPLFRLDINYNLLGYLVNLAVVALGIYVYYIKKNVYAGLSILIGIRVVLWMVLMFLSFLFIAHYYDYSLPKYLNDPDVRFTEEVNRQCSTESISAEEFSSCVESKMSAHYWDYCRDTAPENLVRSYVTERRCPLPD